MFPLKKDTEVCCMCNTSRLEQCTVELWCTIQYVIYQPTILNPPPHSPHTHAFTSSWQPTQTIRQLQQHMWQIFPAVATWCSYLVWKLYRWTTFILGRRGGVVCVKVLHNFCLFVDMKSFSTFEIVRLICPKNLSEFTNILTDT